VNGYVAALWQGLPHGCVRGHARVHEDGHARVPHVCVRERVNACAGAREYADALVRFS
jgi:hypothetical protein